MLVDLNLAEVTREVQEVRDADAALRRILVGAYGLCVDCGEPIGRRRLEAYSTAKRCLGCQRTHDRAAHAVPPPIPLRQIVVRLRDARRHPCRRNSPGPIQPCSRARARAIAASICG